ncbi:MAG: two pore domain potassium channel family protein [Deltaproteobacteria bacterium]|nr:two pore domain potassium channel family protein [Deltaproteobacteria bacterium]
MAKFLKVFINPASAANQKVPSAYRLQINCLKKVWDDDTYGFERIVRLFLCIVQFLYPVLLIRSIFGRFGSIGRKLAVEFYTLIKLLLPLFILLLGLYRYNFVLIITIYLLSETIFHILNLIFLSDIYLVSVSYPRSILLLFLNYIEVVFDFSIIYIGFDLLSEKLSWISALYFSLVTNATVGFGDIYPKTTAGRVVAIFQLLICILFLIVFINYFSQRLSKK